MCVKIPWEIKESAFFFFFENANIWIFFATLIMSDRSVLCRNVSSIILSRGVRRQRGQRRYFDSLIKRNCKRTNFARRDLRRLLLLPVLWKLDSLLQRYLLGSPQEFSENLLKRSDFVINMRHARRESFRIQSDKRLAYNVYIIKC